MVGEQQVDTDCDLITGSEDFAQYLRHVPGCFLDIGNGLEGPCGSSLHNPSYDFNDDILTIGTDFWTKLVEQQLRVPAQ